jgi:hypothetical protein
MQFSELTASEKAAITYRDLQRRKAEKVRGKKAASEHIFENNLRIKKSLREIKKRGLRYAE